MFNRENDNTIIAPRVVVVNTVRDDFFTRNQKTDRSGFRCRFRRRLHSFVRAKRRSSSIILLSYYRIAYFGFAVFRVLGTPVAVRPSKVARLVRVCVCVCAGRVLRTRRGGTENTTTGTTGAPRPRPISRPAFLACYYYHERSSAAGRGPRVNHADGETLRYAGRHVSLRAAAGRGRHVRGRTTAGHQQRRPRGRGLAPDAGRRVSGDGDESCHVISRARPSLSCGALIITTCRH